MPVEPILDHPDVLTFPPAAYGMLARLLHHFWETDLRPLPPGDEMLCGIARAHRPTWRHWKPRIMQAFADISPALELYARTRGIRLDNLRVASQRGGAATQARAAAAALNEAPAPSPAPPFLPAIDAERRSATLARPPAPEARPKRARVTDQSAAR